MAATYADFLKIQAGSLVEAIVEDLEGSKGFDREESKVALTELVDDSIKVCMDSIDAGQDLLVSWTRTLHADLAEKGWGIGDFLAYMASLRRQFISSSLEAVRQGYQGAEQGLLTLVQRCDAAEKLVADLSRDLAEADAEESLVKSQALLQSVVDHIPSIVYVKDLEKRYMLVNRHAADIMYLKPEDIVGKLDHELFPPEVIAEWRKREEAVLSTSKPFFAEDTFEVQGDPRTYAAAVVPITDSNGEICAIGGISTDVTELKSSEQSRVRLQEEVVRAHKQALRELATPLIPITDTIVAMPLVGPVDSTRAKEILETLLEGVAGHGVDTAIIDLTGVSIVDTQVAEVLINVTQAVGLLGAEVLVTGIKPQVAQTLVQLGLDLSSFNTLGTLKSGIAYAMGKKENQH